MSPPAGRLQGSRLHKHHPCGVDMAGKGAIREHLSQRLAVKDLHETVALGVGHSYVGQLD